MGNQTLLKHLFEYKECSGARYQADQDHLKKHASGRQFNGAQFPIQHRIDDGPGHPGPQIESDQKKGGVEQPAPGFARDVS